MYINKEIEVGDVKKWWSRLGVKTYCTVESDTGDSIKTGLHRAKAFANISLYIYK